MKMNTQVCADVEQLSSAAKLKKVKLRAISASKLWRINQGKQDKRRAMFSFMITQRIWGNRFLQIVIFFHSVAGLRQRIQQKLHVQHTPLESSNIFMWRQPQTPV